MPGMDASIENAGRAAKINAEIDKLRQAKPHLSYSQAWHVLTQDKPEPNAWRLDYSNIEAKLAQADHATPGRYRRPA